MVLNTLIREKQNISIRFIREKVLSEIDIEKIEQLIDNHEIFLKEILRVIQKVATENQKYLSKYELQMMGEIIADEIMGLGPLRILMEDEEVSDILVNGPSNIYIEKNGKLEKTNRTFIDNDQLTDIAKRLVAKMGRRIDDAQPLVDARMPDGSRLNVVINPIALDGTSISIRKFNKSSKTLEELCKYGSMNAQIAGILMIASKSRCNIVVSGGTGSGKTTLLNALSHHISDDERIITLEDAAELKLQQPHIVRLETRMAGVENSGQVTMRMLVINALRMRPDRIIVGECRGGEAFEMLQAMNTGHDGSMTTLHANSPFDAMSRLENLVMMAGFNLPIEAIRHNIASAVNIIVQIARLNDGSRKVIKISELMGIENGQIKLYDIFDFQVDKKRDKNGRIQGHYIFNHLPQNSILEKNSMMFDIYPELEKIVKSLEPGDVG
ncbi:CpaF family protein [Helicobacter cappadocius]|uniref:CpaF family protein n=1 Tax=Helicobacter cappadocius TaxID=3063998 RepID=A0AA90PQA7_9HELI|nr:MULTISPECIES: CpaF family protein [unclassified Helicobacter]MDO7253123.1 CpaF family protein [Helicobacter sp. faydin-H75]MDP2538751.1 CpaF family protein [Helicobacter sp. faydin-H76]